MKSDQLVNPDNLVNPASVTVEGLFSNTTYRIPEYQRDYVWGKEHAAQLLNDIIAGFSKGESSRKYDPYFLGAIVTIRPDGPANVRREVVDGQQRLITLTLICSALESCIEAASAQAGSAKPELEDDLDVLGRCIRKLEGAIRSCRVELGLPKNHNAFQDIVSTTKKNPKSFAERIDELAVSIGVGKKGKRPGATRRAIVEAAREIDNILKDFVRTAGANPEDKLHALRRYITEAVVLLRIEVLCWENAHDLFESMNFKGVKLAFEDRIKNQVLKHSPAIKKSDLANGWAAAKSLVDDLETSVGFGDLLHYSYLSRVRTEKAKNLATVVERSLEACGDSSEYAKSVLDDATALSEIIRVDHGVYHKDVHAALESHRDVLKVKFAYVGLLALRKRFSGAQSKGADHNACIKSVINFIFRYMKVLRHPDSVLMDIMADYAKLVRDGASIQKLRDFLETKAPDDDFKKEFRELKLKDSRLGYYVVAMLEIVIAGPAAGVVPRPQGRKQHLEHVLPRQPKASDWGHISDVPGSEEFNERCESIGNLLPLSQPINTQIQNRGIVEKITNYERQALQSPKEINRYLIGDLWTYESIDSRSQDLADKYAIKAWPL